MRFLHSLDHPMAFQFSTTIIIIMLLIVGLFLVYFNIVEKLFLKKWNQISKAATHKSALYTGVLSLKLNL